MLDSNTFSDVSSNTNARTLLVRLLQTTDDENTSNSRSSSEVAKDVVIIFLAGVAVVIGLVLLVYLIAIVFDRFCCCFPWFTPIPTTGRHGEGNMIDQGVVARRAGLWGLKRDERTRILEEIIVAEKYQKRHHSELGNDTTKDNDTDEGDPVSKSTRNDGDSEEVMGMDAAAVVGDVHHETTCAICLTEYEDGDLVVHGTSCQHLFHKDCVYEWLFKHDQCPYCRKEMITPAEMRETAIEVLGQSRVQHMSMWGVTEELMNTSNNIEAGTSHEDEEEASVEQEATASSPDAAVATETLTVEC